VVCDFSNPIVDPHDVGILNVFGDEVTYMMPLNGSPDLVDGPKALLRGGVTPIDDFVQSLVEVPDGWNFPEPPTSVCSLFVLVAPGVLGFSSLICKCVS
jgi:hypothetical protein